MVVILHSGQTGVERGAHRAAAMVGFDVAGFMPIDCRDELGVVPPDVAKFLTPCFDRGPRPAVKANVALASGVLLVVPNAQEPEKFTAMAPVLHAARAAQAPVFVCDAKTNVSDVARWAQQLPETSGSVRILVTGPRGTRWHEGEAVARRLVAAIGITG